MSPGHRPCRPRCLTPHSHPATQAASPAHGDQAKAALIGTWQKGGRGGYEFKADGSLIDLNEAEAFRPRITYRFRDDRTIELEKIGPFDPNDKRTLTYRVLIDQTTLYLADMDGAKVRTLDGPYRRSTK